MNVYDILDNMITAEEQQQIIKHYTGMSMKEIHDVIEEKEKQFNYLMTGDEDKSGFLCKHGLDECSTCSDSSTHPKEDMVNRPSHYNYGDIECIDAIRAMLGDDGFVAYCKGNALKYTWRAGLKSDTEEDLKKAAWYNRMAAGDDPRKTKLGWVKDE